MNTDPSDPRADKHLDKGLEMGLASVRSAWTGMSHPEPPKLIDQAVLNRARRALESPSEPGRSRLQIRWLGAFATAAVLVLAATLVVQQGDNAPLPVSTEQDGLRLDRDEFSAGERSKQVKAAPAKILVAPRMAEPLKEGTPDAEYWVQQLLTLKMNNDENLSAELAAFRAAYPDYPLPASLDTPDNRP